MDLLDALDAAINEFGARLALVRTDEWCRPTPCPGWDVRYLVAHVVGGNRFAGHVLGGMTAAAAIDAVMSSPQLEDDPMASWVTSSSAQRAAFSAAGVLEQRVDHPLGVLSGFEFLQFRVFDIAVHAWDLAQAIGVDDSLPAELVEAVLAIVENGPPGMGFDIVAMSGAGPMASRQQRLLALAGRNSVG